MALDFSPAASGRRVALATSFANNVNPATFLALVWRKTNLAGTERLFAKGTGTNRHSFLPETRATVPSWLLARGRNTTALEVAAPFTNFAADGACKWLFVVGQSDTGTAGNNKLFVGDERLLAAEPSAYTTQTNGAGTAQSNAGLACQIGNQDSQVFGFNGFMAWLGVATGLLTTAQIHEIQRALFEKGSNGATGVQFLTLLDMRLGYEGTGRCVDFGVSRRFPLSISGPVAIEDPPFMRKPRVRAKAPAVVGGAKPWLYYAHQQRQMSAS